MPADEIRVVRDRETLRQIADTLPDGPVTVISRHLLKRGLCTAYVVGDVGEFVALIIDGGAPGEPSCYGSCIGAIWAALQQIPDWFAANVDEEVADDLPRRVREVEGVTTRTLGDLHFVLRQPVEIRPHALVRLLTPADAEMIDHAPASLRGAGFETPLQMLVDGVVAAAIDDGNIVAIAHTSAVTEGYADIGVATAEDWRGRGISTACASLVAHAIQKMGWIPVWSCGETNRASLRVAEKLGFEFVTRRVYVIREDRRA